MSTESIATLDRPYHHGDLKEGCIRVGIELLKELGLEKFSLREVSRRLGVSATAIYHHFPAKEDLLKAIAYVGLSEFAELFKSSYDAADNPNTAIVSIGTAYVHFFLGKPYYLDLLFAHQHGTDPEIDCMWTDTFKLLESLLIARGIGEKEAQLVGIWLWSGVHGLSTMFRDNILGQIDNCTPDRPEVFRMTIDQLLPGVLHTVAQLLESATSKK